MNLQNSSPDQNRIRCAVLQKPLAAFLYFLLSNASKKKQFIQWPSIKMVVFIFLAIVEDWAVQVDEDNECELTVEQIFFHAKKCMSF